MSNNAKLGRGLDKLFAGPRARASAAEEPALEVAAAPKALVPRDISGEASKIGLGKIDPNPWQPRRDFRADELDDLVGSMREHGLLQPVTLRRQGDRYQIIAGERRFRAARLLDWSSIPALVREASDRDMLELAILENLQRADLNPLDVALAYRRLMEEFKLTQEEVANKVGTSRPQVANTLRLLELPGELKVLLTKGDISAGAGRALLGFPDPRRQLELARQVAQGLLTVRQLEELVQSHRKPMPRPTGPKPVEPNLAELTSTMGRTLGMKVAIRGSSDRGTLTIRYGDRRQLDALYRALTQRAVAKPVPQLDEDESDELVT